jgi:hypothetical protein
MILIFDAYRKSTTVLSIRINRNVLTCSYAGYRIEIHTRAQGWIVYTACAAHPSTGAAAVVCWKCWCPVTRELLSGAAAAVPPTPPPLFATQSIIRIYDATQWAERGKMESWTIAWPGHCNRSPSKARENIYTRMHTPHQNLLLLLCYVWWWERCEMLYRNEVKEGAKAFIAFCYVLDLISPSRNPLFLLFRLILI